MNEPKTDAEIADLARRLASILDDAEHGLTSWASARARLGRELYDALGDALGGRAVTRPPGEPPADALAEHLADVQVMDGPRAGEVWTYAASKGGYVLAGEGDETICDDIGALLEHVQCEVVRPVQEER